MKHKFQKMGIALLVLFALGLIWWFRQPLGHAGEAVAVYARSIMVKKAPVPQPVIPVAVQLDTICAELKASKDPATTHEILARLRNLLNSLPPAVASREVQAFLATNNDAATDLDLTVQQGGMLGDSSSMRVFLLDYLGLLDKPAAGTIAMQILAHYTTPDEWAVSLRNYAWAHPGPDSQNFLKTKTSELLANSAWIKDPSAGFLEAFDAIVYAQNTDLAPTLSALVRDKDNQAVAHAAYLTMDRLVIEQPVPMLKDLVSQPDSMKGRELTRADFVARADLGQTDQRALVKEYLLDPTRNPQELNTFAATFPNDNYMISNNLLTGIPTPNEQILVQRDRDALKTVEQWQKDPQFKGIQPLLNQMQQRLAYFVQQADVNKP
jgi:hypothetical protein